MVRICLLFCVFLLMGRGGFAQNTAENLFEQGQSAISQGETSRAIDLFERSIDINPDYAPAYSSLGMLYLENNGKLDDVVWLFQQAAELEPQNAEHYTNMCRAYFQSQKPDWAEAACLKALSIEPNSGSAQLTLAWIYLMGKVQPAESVKYFNEVIKRIPNNPKIYYGLGMAYARNNEPGKALEVITILRSMGGQESLANQLERMIRPSAAPVEMTELGSAPIVRPSIDAGPSQIITAKIPEPPPVVTAGDGPLPGTIRIQLKARLPPAEAEQGKDSKAKKKGSDDGYSVNDYRPLTIKERQERVKRMRGNMGTASGSGTITTQTTGAP